MSAEKKKRKSIWGKATDWTDESGVKKKKGAIWEGVFILYKQKKTPVNHDINED